MILPIHWKGLKRSSENPAKFGSINQLSWLTSILPDHRVIRGWWPQRQEFGRSLRSPLPGELRTPSPQHYIYEVLFIYVSFNVWKCLTGSSPSSSKSRKITNLLPGPNGWFLKPRDSSPSPSMNCAGGRPGNVAATYTWLVTLSRVLLSEEADRSWG